MVLLPNGLKGQLHQLLGSAGQGHQLAEEVASPNLGCTRSCGHAGTFLCAHKLAPCSTEQGKSPSEGLRPQRSGLACAQHLSLSMPIGLKQACCLRVPACLLAWPGSSPSLQV